MARVVVVGGGFAGMAAAARLAKLGHPVTLLEARDRLGGALGLLERDGFVWDTGPTATALPAVLRDLFRKSGRPLERELDLAPVQPMREHRFGDGTVLPLPSGSRSAQLEAVDDALGAGLGRQWVDYTHGFADTWDALRRGVLERPYDEEHAPAGVHAVLHGRASLARAVRRRLSDPRLRELALHEARAAGQDPRDTPAWFGVTAYVEQNFGTWTVPGGMGLVTEALARRLDQRGVDVRLGSAVRDVVVQAGAARGVVTDDGPVPADVVVCAVDPRRLPALAHLVARSTPALPPRVVHVGLRGPVLALPAEVVLHGDPLLVLRTSGRAPEGYRACSLLVRGDLREDPLVALARRGLDVREQVVARVDLSPRDLVADWHGSPLGLLWQGRRSVRHRLPGRTPVAGGFCVGAAAALLPGLPWTGLTAAVVAARIGPAERVSPPAPM